jgi:diguanylate cyclase (GGDEF)-like protein
MRGLWTHWLLIGLALVTAVLGASLAVYRVEVDHQAAVESARARQAESALRVSIRDVITREQALARVIGSLRSPIGNRWPILASVVTGGAANSAAFIVPVAQRERSAFEHRTGLRLTESPSAGVIRPAADRPLHLVVVDESTRTSAGSLGLDVAANPLRASLLLASARTGRQLASPPVKFIGPSLHQFGVILYAPVRNQRGALEGWVVSSFRALPLARSITSEIPGMSLTIKDGSTTLVGEIAHPTGRPASMSLAGRHWSVWASAGAVGNTDLAWLVLSLGLCLAVAITLVLRQTATRESYATRMLEERDQEEAALGRIATAVAEQVSPGDLLARVAEEVGRLLSSRTAAVSRFEPQRGRGVLVGSWTPDDEDLIGSTYALNGVTASARAYSTGQPARTTQYESSSDPVAGLMRTLGGVAGIAAPINVAGQPWGALGAAYASAEVPEGAEPRLERFARLVGLAISNAAAWDKLSEEATTDSLTGIPNRRVFDAQLQREVARSRRYGRKLSLAVLDVDHFKQVNDRFGHQAGDRVLARIAELLTATAREGELVARIGGEEFAWLMPETDADGALVAAERARIAVAAEQMPDVGSVTISIGIRSAGGHDHPVVVINDADQALYWAKQSGRNMSFIYTEEARRTLAGGG